MIRKAEDSGAGPAAKREIAILAAETDAVRSARLSRSLMLLGYSPEATASPREVLEMIRRRVFDGALIAAELTWQGEPVLSRVSRLPSIRSLVAIGPAGDARMETLARLSGANAYLPRPVTIESLAKVLRAPADRQTPSPGTYQRHEGGTG